MSTAAESLRVSSFIDSRYSRADVRHAFKTSFGEDIDCVDYLAQPAFKTPGMRKHPLSPGMMRRSRTGGPPGSSTGLLPPLIGNATADDNGNARSCPDGTVPIVRITASTISNAGGLDRFLTSSHKHVLPHRGELAPLAPSVAPAPPDLAGYHHVLGVDYFAPAGSNAFDSILAVYNPTTVDTDHSISQIWMLSPGSTKSQGCVAPNCIQSLEAGWNVDFSLYGDRLTHFFTYSTQDGYDQTGAYNLSPDSQFVLLPGASFTPGQVLGTSLAGSANPQEFELGWEVGIDPDSQDGVWYLWANFNQLIGFIPSYLFTNGQGGSAPMHTTYTEGQAGGEVYSPATDSTTDMGSGQFADLGAWQAAYHRNVFNGIDGNYASTSVLTSPSSTNGSEYDGKSNLPAGAAGWGTFFYYGGPGLTAPLAPTGLSATATGGKVNLRWNNTTFATSYTIKRATKSGGPYTNIATNNFPGFGMVPNFQDGTGKKGTKYFYVVAAVDSLGSGPNSNQVSATP